MKRILVSAMLSFLVVFAFGQDAGGNLSWKKKKKIAESFLEKGDYASAGQYFRSAWKSKTSMPELAFNAGEAFYKIRDYLSAAQAYEPIKENREEYNIAGLKYANCLKLSGQYDDAIRAFDSYIDNYRGEDIEETKAIVAKEIKGCKLGKELQAEEPDRKSTIEHLNYQINSAQVEFNPRAVSKDKIYFSSVEDGSARIFYSEKVGNKWERRRKMIVRGLEFPHSGNVAFSPSDDRIYFTQCDVNIEMVTFCAIYTAEKTVHGYSEPQRLPTSINAPNSSNTHPYIFADGGKEILMFSSNRDGGEGGMDLYYAYRNVESTENSFTDAQNMGVKINTSGEESTPYYDVDAKTLYFSSTGHISIGGYDIFSAEGTVTSWDRPNNLGLPFNSSADDIYYSEVAGTNSAFFVSNRVLMPDKISTNDDDIFFVRTDEPEVLVNGYVTVQENPDDILDLVDVTLYEILGDGSLATVNAKSFDDGFYQFKLKPSKSYRIEAEKVGYLNAFFDLKTYDVNKSIEVHQDIPMEDMMVASKPELSPAEIASIIPDGEGPITSIKVEDKLKPVIVAVPDPELNVEVEAMETELNEMVEAPLSVEEGEIVARIEGTPELEEPIAETPTLEEPVIEPIVETLIEEPVIEPIAETPTFEEPIVETPILEEPVIEPIAETPTLEPMVEPIAETPFEEPIVETPALEEPVIEPISATPTLEPMIEPIAETPTFEEPIVETPALEEPVIVETPVIEPIVETPVFKEPIVDPPIAGIAIETPELNTSNTLETNIEGAPILGKGQNEIGIGEKIRDYPGESIVTNSVAPESNGDNLIAEPNVPSAVSYDNVVRPKEYKIQLAAVADFIPSRYNRVETIGQIISLEGIDTDSGYLTRVLVDGFTSYAEAKAVLEQIQAAGFPRSFMVRYDNGVRNPRSMRR